MSHLLVSRFIETDPFAFQCLFRCFSVVSTSALTSTITKSENRKNFWQTTTPSRRKIKTLPTGRRTSKPETLLSAFLFSFLVCFNMICAKKSDFCSYTKKSWNYLAEKKNSYQTILYSLRFLKASKVFCSYFLPRKGYLQLIFRKTFIHACSGMF